MYYIGIVGALSSLGQKVAEMLQTEPSKYKVIFAVDKQYAYPDLVQAQFQNLDQVLSRNLTPTLVLDFGPTEDAIERAKFYRQYGMPAVMQTVFDPNKRHMLRNIGSSSMQTPLVLIPDFSVVKTNLVENIKAQVRHFSCDVNRIYVNVLHNTEDGFIRGEWLYWASVINELLGEYTEKYSQKGNALTLGFVRISSAQTNLRDEHSEEIAVKLDLAEDKGTAEWKWKGNLLDSRVEGVKRILHWYKQHMTTDVNLAMGELFVDVLS